MEEKKDFTMMFKKEKKPEPLSKEETIKQVVKADRLSIIRGSDLYYKSQQCKKHNHKL